MKKLLNALHTFRTLSSPPFLLLSSLFSFQVYSNPFLCDQLFHPTLQTENSSDPKTQKISNLQAAMNASIFDGKILNIGKVNSLSKQILGLQPNNLETQMYFLLSSMSLGNFSEAQQFLATALKEDPQNAIFQILFARTLTKYRSLGLQENPRQIVQTLYERGHLQESDWSELGRLALSLKDDGLFERIQEKLKSEHPRSEQILKLQLEFLSRKKNYGIVVEKTDQLSEERYRDLDILEMRARALLELNRPKEAIHLIEANSFQDKRPHSLDFVYAEALYSLHFPKEALITLERAMSNRTIPHRHYIKLRYKILKTLREYDLAFQQLHALKRHFPKDSLLAGAFIELYFLKSASIRKSHPSESLALLDEAYEMVLNALKIKPDDEFILKYYARILIKKGQDGNAQPVLKQLLQMNPEDLDYQDMATVVNLRLENFDTALDMGRKLYATNPKDPIYLDHIARALFGLGRFQEAADMIEQGLRNGFSDHLTQLNLAKAYEQTLQFDKAIEILQTIQKNEPESYFIKNILVRVQRKKETYKENK